MAIPLKDWQKEVLKSKYLMAGEFPFFGEKNPTMKIISCKKEYAMSVLDCIAAIKNSKKKPLIMDPNDPFHGTYADKKLVIEELKKRI